MQSAHIGLGTHSVTKTVFAVIAKGAVSLQWALVGSFAFGRFTMGTEFRELPDLSTWERDLPSPAATGFLLWQSLQGLGRSGLFVSLL